MKVFDGNNPEAVSTFAQELKAYQKLHELQGQVIPVLRSFGRMAHTGCPAIATCWAGHSMEARHDVSKELLDSAKVALRAIHERHVSHGDVRLQNMLNS